MLSFRERGREREKEREKVHSGKIDKFFLYVNVKLYKWRIQD